MLSPRCSLVLCACAVVLVAAGFNFQSGNKMRRIGFRTSDKKIHALGWAIIAIGAAQLLYGARLLKLALAGR